MSAEILDYLSELDAKNTVQILDAIKQRKLAIKIKAPESDKIESVSLYATSLINTFNLLFRKDLKIANELVAFKVAIGTDIYFFKTIVHVKNATHYIKTPFQIFKLVRRINTRYVIPATWPQSGMILASKKKMLNTKMRIIEISQTGVRMHVLNQLPHYEKDQQIRMQFKMYRRSEVTVNGIVRHVKHNYKDGQLLGVEFIEETLLSRDKIKSICEDLVHHQL